MFPSSTHGVNPLKLAVTGSTGQLGRLVVASLVRLGHGGDVVALARSAARASDLGVTVREADYAQPASFESALAGVETLLLISSSEVGQRIEQHRNVINAAKAAGVKRVIYTSLLHADTSTLSLAAEHLATEAELKASGLGYTILRNGWYTENYTGSVDGALAGGAVLGSSGNGRISAAARVDYAEAAARALIEDGHEGKVYELAGDTSFTLDDFAAELSRQAGRDIPYKNLPEADYAAALAGFGLPAWLGEAIASWGVATAGGALYNDGHELSKLIGRPTTPLADSIREALG